MQNFEIGISGLTAAQKALDIIGNNIANAATEGYHRQRIELNPAYFGQVGSTLVGGGVDFEGITRMIDTFLEDEILSQQSLLGQLNCEVNTLSSVESAFGELYTQEGGLNATIDKFFNSLAELSVTPHEITWQEQVVSDAEAMAYQFRTLGDFLVTLDNRIKLEAETIVESVNTLTKHIAELNGEIKRLQIAGSETSSLCDQRDQAIKELSELIGVQTQSREWGVVDVRAGGIMLVMETSYNELEAGLDDNGDLAISVAETFVWKTDIQGGRLGGLLSLKNEIVGGIETDLNSLAETIVQQINQYHVQGVGSDGSFTDLSGWVMASEDLADFEPPITDGHLYIRVTDTTTGAITREDIDLSTISPLTLSDIATEITNRTGLTAQVLSNNRFNIQAESGYTFDFLPAVLPEPTVSSLNGASPPTISVSGIYTGTSNDTLKFTVVGAGSVGNGTLQLVVKDGGGAGSVVATLDIGSGYSAGDELAVGDTEIKISLSRGDLDETDNDYFEVDVFADTDTSDFLSAVGINTFFSGSTAVEMSVCSEISASPARIATALGPDMTDNANVKRMAELRDEAISSLGSMTFGEFYRRLTTNIGQQLYIKQSRQGNVEGLLQNLRSRQAEVSGVDINEEAAQLLIFEQMYQALAKYMSTIQSSIYGLMEVM